MENIKKNVGIKAQKAKNSLNNEPDLSAKNILPESSPDSFVKTTPQELRAKKFRENQRLLSNEFVSAGETFVAAAKDNPIGRLIQNDLELNKQRQQLQAEQQAAISEGKTPPSDFGKNLFDIMEEADIPRNMWLDLAKKSNTKAELFANFEQRKKIQRDRLISSTGSGAAAMAGGFVAGAVSPFTVIGSAVPVFSAFNSVAKGASASSAALRAGASGVKAGAAGAAFDEALLSRFDDERTTTESVTNVIGSAGFGGALGVTAGSVASVAAATQLKELARQRNVLNKTSTEGVGSSKFVGESDLRVDPSDTGVSSSELSPSATRSFDEEIDGFFNFQTDDVSTKTKEQTGEIVLGSMFGSLQNLKIFKSGRKAYDKSKGFSGRIGKEFLDEAREFSINQKTLYKDRVKPMAEAISKKARSKKPMSDFGGSEYLSMHDSVDSSIINGELRTNTFDLDSKLVGSFGATTGFSRFSPIMVGMTSNSNEMRLTTQKFWESNLLTEGNLKGVKTEQAASTDVDRMMGNVAQIQTRTDEHYKAYLERTKDSGEPSLSAVEFRQEIGKHRALKTESDIIEVNLAQRDADQFYGRFGQEAFDAGLLKTEQDPTNFINTRFLKNKIGQQPQLAKPAFIEGIRRGKKRSIAAIENARARNAPVSEITRRTANVQDKEIDAIADSMIEAITKDAPDMDAFDLMQGAKAGTFKGRNLDIDLEPLLDFIDLDINSLTFTYGRNVSPDIALNRRFGSVDLKKQKERVTKEFDEMIANAKSGDEKFSLERQKSRELESLDFSVKALRNRTKFNLETSQGVRLAVKGSMAITFMANMGMFAATIIPELAMPVVNNGFKNTYGRALKDVSKFGKELKLTKLDGIRLGIVTDSIMANRMAALTDSSFLRTGESQLERAIDNSVGFMSKVFGLPVLNDAMRLNSTVSNQAIIKQRVDDLVNGKISKKDLKELSNLGIDEVGARKIQEQMAKHGETTEEGIFAPNPEQWEQPVERLYANALLKSVNNDVLMPNAGNAPQIAQSAIGKVAFFLRSFSAAATDRIFVANGQRLDKQKAQALTAFIGMGLLSHIAYETIRGREVNYDDPDELIAGALFRTGIFGFGNEFNSMALDTINGDASASTVFGASGQTAENFATGDIAENTPARNFIGLEIIKRMQEGVTE